MFNLPTYLLAAHGWHGLRKWMALSSKFLTGDDGH